MNESSLGSSLNLVSSSIWTLQISKQYERKQIFVCCCDVLGTDMTLSHSLLVSFNS